MKPRPKPRKPITKAPRFSYRFPSPSKKAPRPTPAQRPASSKPPTAQNLARSLLLCSTLAGYCTQLCAGQIHLYNPPLQAQRPLSSWLELRDKNLTRQQYDYSCGAASLSTILSYFYATPTSEKEILESLLQEKGIKASDTTGKKTDLSFSDLASFARSKGFYTQGLALSLEALSKLQIPVIIYVNVRNREHFTVYRGMDSRFVYLADPSLGNIKVSHGAFVEMFYQRKDLSYPGKILAILSDEAAGDPRFLTHENSPMVYKSIWDFRSLRP